MVGGAFGPGFVAFEVGMEALFCMMFYIAGKYVSLKSIGVFSEGWDRVMGGGVAMGREIADPSWANGIVRGTGVDGP